jgi:hypothetical protein
MCAVCHLMRGHGHVGTNIPGPNSWDSDGRLRRRCYQLQNYHYEHHHAGVALAPNEWVGGVCCPSTRPGYYTVEAEAAGFKKEASQPVLLEVSRDVRVDLKLQPGATNETVQVTAEGVLADTTDTTLEGVLSNKAINEMPLQGRDFQNLLPARGIFSWGRK